MKRIIAVAAVSMMILPTLPAFAQYNENTLNPQDTNADSGSVLIDPQTNAPMGVDNFVTRSIDSTFGLLTSGNGQSVLGACADTDQPRTPGSTSGMGNTCD